jgi:hypothetical protein
VDATFRLRRSYRNQGFGLLAFFLSWFVLIVFTIGTDQKIPNRLAMVAGLGAVPLFMAGLSVFILAAYWREELTIRGDRVTFRGVLRDKAIDLGEVTKARWWTATSAEGGSLVLRTESTRFVISLNNYEAEEQERIVNHLRSVLPAEIQVGWNLFAYRAEQRAVQAAKTKPGPDEVLVSRDRWDRFLLPSLAALSLVVVAAWRLTGELRYLASPLVLLVFWAILRFMTPAKGMISQKLSASRNPEFGGFAWFCLFWGLVAAGGLMINEHFRPRMERLDAILVVGCVVWFGVLIFEAHRFDRPRVRREQEAADLAAKARGETTADPWRAEDAHG